VWRVTFSIADIRGFNGEPQFSAPLAGIISAWLGRQDRQI
jgi:hypothetical protein